MREIHCPKCKRQYTVSDDSLQIKCFCGKVIRTAVNREAIRGFNHYKDLMKRRIN